ncbi:MAG: flippase [Candidatus Pacebacteria bacterium]|nr:flippase [Candidatus Paceibacterota bacterium]
MSKIQNIAKNTSYLTLALVAQKIISFTYFTILARNLAPESLGKYYLAISLTTIFAIFIDLGLVNVLTREVAKTPERTSKLLGSVLALKIPLSALALLATVATVFILDYGHLTRQLVYISSICMVLDSFTMTFFGVSRGRHNLFYESLASIVFQVIVMVFGLLALFSGLDLRYIMGALALASIFNFLYSWLVLRLKLKVKIKLFYEKTFLKYMLVLAWPFAAYAVLQRVYTYLDSVLLSLFSGETAVGIYQIPFKIIFALQFLPLAFTASLYPALSYYWLKDQKQLRVSFSRAMNYLTIISVPIVFGTIFLANRIIGLFQNNYLSAVLPLQIIIVALFFIFVNYPIGALLNACDRQKQNTRNMLIVTIFSIVLNLILIPKFGVIGASLTVVFTNFLMFILGIYWVKKTIVYQGKNNLIVFSKVLLSGLVMGLFLEFFKPYINILILMVLASLVYFALLYLLKGFRKADILSIYKAFAKKKAF